LDGIIGNILESVKEDVNIFVLSDHGFGPQDQVFYVNRWLEENNFLSRKKKKNRQRDLLLRKVGKQIRSIDRKLKTDLLGLGKKTVRNVRGDSYGEQFDLERSKAIAGRYSDTAGGIHILDKWHYDALRDKIINQLERFGERMTPPVRINAYKKEEIYKGEYLKLAPDIIFFINDFRCSIRAGFPDNETLFEPKTPTTSKSGTHRKEGVLIIHGSGIQKGKIEARIYDIAPTLLYMFDQPIPNDLDGHVLLKIFTDEFRKEKDLKYLYASGTKDIPENKLGEESLEDRLRNLGYL
jgi:predicted AlkP superfamily phosphohydrolase/phosphomutase